MGENTLYTYHDAWDQQHINGCKCDKGYEGPGCSLFSCPFGDDPMTLSQYDEMQTIKCNATSGSFTLSFAKKTTELINWDDTALQMKAKLEALPTLAGVKVTLNKEISITQTVAGLEVTTLHGTVCHPSGQAVNVEFTQNFGDQPLMLLTVKEEIKNIGYETNETIAKICSRNASLEKYSVECGWTFMDPYIYLKETRVGTRESEICSNRGLCDPTNGICTCVMQGGVPAYDTSNGASPAAAGDAFNNRGDCGFPIISITACPGEVECSGHGLCASEATVVGGVFSLPTFRCACSVGWQGTDCSEMQCQKGKAWFDLPIADGVAHQLVECSNMGICDRTKGDCTCELGYFGGGCERMMCPGMLGKSFCNGHGRCLEMRRLAEELQGTSQAAVHADVGMQTSQSYGKTPNNPLTWDFDSMQGCHCDDGYTGYDCSLRKCKTGPDPMDRGGLGSTFETQDVNCVGQAGEWTLTFRGGGTATRDIGSREGKFTTGWLRWDATEADVKKEMEKLTAVGKVNVKFSRKLNATDAANDRFCTATAAEETNHVLIQFLDELGNLPTMKMKVRDTFHLVNNVPESDGTLLSYIVHGDGNGLSVKGTKQDHECSGRGICHRATGKCLCYSGYTSSDGRMKPGDRGDCGAVLEYDLRIMQ